MFSEPAIIIHSLKEANTVLKHTSRKLRNLVVLLAIILAMITSFVGFTSHTSAEQNCQTFTETGKTVCGRFLDYWNKNGGLAQQGYPVSNEFQETSDTDGKTYMVQYFQRARFELHPENQSPNDVLLGLLGWDAYNMKYGNMPAGDGNVNYGLKLGSVEFCKALSSSIGGPKYKWWGTQAANGNEVSNSCVLREADDRDPIGWELNIPDGVTGHLWIFNPALNTPSNHVSLTVVGPAVIKNGWLVSRATLYFKTGITHGHPGQWTYGVLAWNQDGPCGWTNVNQMPSICDKVDPVTGYPMVSGGSTGNGGATGDCTNMAALRSKLSGKGDIDEKASTGDYLIVKLTEDFTVPPGVVAQWPGNPTNNTPSDGKVVLPKGTVATLYPTCK